MLLAASRFSLAASRDSHPGAVELSGSTGVLLAPEGVGNHPLFGGGVYVSLNRFLAIGADGVYSRLLDKQIQSVRTRADVFGLTGNVRFSIPTGTRVTPYAAAGAGFARENASATLMGQEISARHSNNPLLHAGGGVKIALGRSFGIRGEAMLLRYHDAYAGTTSAGAYYEFGAR